MQIAAFVPSETNVVTGRYFSDLDLLQGHSFIALKLLLIVKPDTATPMNLLN